METAPIDGPTFISYLTASRTVFDLVFRELSPANIIYFSWTCRACRVAVQSYLRRAYDINKHLSRYFSSPSSFRALQSRTGALISGSSALQFMDRTFYAGSDLDIYVDRRFGKEVGQWLISEGFQYKQLKAKLSPEFDVAFEEFGMEPDGEIIDLGVLDPIGPLEIHYPWRGIARVFNFFKPSGLQVQLITASITPLIIILYFHSTCVMNVISHRAAYSLYPILTFEQRRSLICATLGTRQEAAREKYIRRGWTMFEVSEGRFYAESSLSAGIRRVGDRRCWTIPLPAISTDAGMPRLPFDPVAACTWSLQYMLESPYGSRRGAETQFAVMEAPFLKWRYTIETELYPYVQHELGKMQTVWRAASERQSKVLPCYDAEICELLQAAHMLRESKLKFAKTLSLGHWEARETGIY